MAIERKKVNKFLSFSKTCPKCQGGMQRSEKSLLFALATLLVVGTIGGVLHFYLSRVEFGTFWYDLGAYLVYGLVIIVGLAWAMIFYHGFFDRKYTYICKKCQAKEEVLVPITFAQIFVLFIAFSIFLLIAGSGAYLYLAAKTNLF